MNVDQLVKRLRTAHNQKKKSLRQLAIMCDVSHEQIRKIVLNGKINSNIETYNKIDAGLKAHDL